MSREVASALPISAGPSTSNDTASIGSGGTTDIHNVRCSGLGAAASRLARLPSAQPKAPSTTSRKGPQLVASARLSPTSARPATATPTPRARRGVSRSRRSSTPSTTVKGADACSTRDASPAGKPAAIPR